MAKQTVVGKAGYIKWGGSGGSKIYITKWTATLDVKLADTTDSADYDATTALVWNTQIPASSKITVEVEGNYDLNGSQTPFVTKVMSGSAVPVVAELGFNATTPWGYAAFDVDDFKPENPIEDTVTFSASLVSNGKFTLGAAP